METMIESRGHKTEWREGGKIMTDEVVQRVRRPRWLMVALAVLAGLTIGFGANAYLVDGETRPAAARDGGNLVSADGIDANVRIDGKGPPVVLIHGFGAAIDWWDGIAPGLAQHHQVVRIDLIGHGGTAAPTEGYAIARQAALVGAVLDKLGLERVSVVGHSMGGEVATALTEARPGRIDRLVVIDTPPDATATFDILTDLYLQPMIGEALARMRDDRALRAGLAQAFAPGFPMPERFVADVKQLTYAAFRSAHDESLAYRTAKSTAERLAAITPVPPLLVIFGARDAIVPPSHAMLFGRVPDARLIMIDDVGHSPMVEAPERVLALIEGFLDQQP
jgi:pimeloyl-ACP methyl ester carboxylesterase